MQFLNAILWFDSTLIIWHKVTVKTGDIYLFKCANIGNFFSSINPVMTVLNPFRAERTRSGTLVLLIFLEFSYKKLTIVLNRYVERIKGA